ncbi:MULTISPECIES: cell division protein FtsQ/DivIB [Anaerolinea]|uniref:cell division protein FtsQ/DivIB n=1 Tax=Anaerolinea TaxID=233189 RepID=UPI0026102667|nr:FtsQ-type POTRA domain-containing protein [Anaerolinea thermophila]
MNQSKSPNRSRIEEVRQRRAQRTAQRTETASRRATTATPARPVIIRNATFGTPIHRQVATHRPRRTYYVATGMPGVEMRLPSIPVVRPGWRTLSAMLVLAALIGIFSLWASPFFQVDTVAFEGMERLTVGDLEPVVNLHNLAIVEVDATAVKEELLRFFPDLENVQVQVGLPNTVKVVVTERRPILAWQKEDQVMWIDAKGFIFPARGSVEGLLTVFSNDKPPVAVPPEESRSKESAEETPEKASAGNSKPALKTTPEQIDPQILQTIQRLATLLPENSVIAYDDQNGIGWKAPDGLQVYIGKDLSNFELKYAMAEQIAQQLYEKGIYPALLNVADPDAPFYRMEQ